MKIFLTGYNGKPLQAVIKAEAKSLGLKPADIAYVDLIVRPDVGGLSVSFFGKPLTRVFGSDGKPITTNFLGNIMI